MKTNTKTPLRLIGSGQRFITNGKFPRVFVRGATRWASYLVRDDGTVAEKSTRHDGRELFAIVANA